MTFLACKITKNELHARFNENWASVITKMEVFLHYEAVQVVLQSKVGMQIRTVFITNLGQILQSGETIIRKWSRYYEIGKLFQSR